MTIQINADNERFVRDALKAGQYNSADEVVADSLKLLREVRDIPQDQIPRIRAQIAEGMAALDRGERVDGEEVFAEIARRSQQRRGLIP
jgi:putative addiction module CopG family antidote